MLDELSVLVLVLTRQGENPRPFVAYQSAETQWPTAALFCNNDIRKMADVVFEFDLLSLHDRLFWTPWDRKNDSISRVRDGFIHSIQFSNIQQRLTEDVASV